MARALHFRPFVAKSQRRGFTLIELMIVVVIVGILATLAVVGYRKLVQSSHVSEATGMVQNIRVAQESYHSETQQYANISQSLTAWYPAAPVYGVLTGWGADCGNCTAVTWAMLPLHVDGPVLFGYATIAGTANPTNFPASLTVNGNTVTLTAPTTDWYLIAAAADLDNSPATTTNVYGTSFTNQVLVSNEGQ